MSDCGLRRECPGLKPHDLQMICRRAKALRLIPKEATEIFGTHLSAAELADEFGAGEVEGCYAECAPGDGSEGDRDEVADLSCAVGHNLKEELDAGEADKCCEEAAADLGELQT